MTNSFIGMLVTSGGENVKSHISLDKADMWSPLKHTIWSVPACEVRSRQPATIPLRPDHGMAPVGAVTALQRRPDGSIWAAGTVDERIQVPNREDTFLSVEARLGPGGTTIEGAAVCAKSCMVGVAPAKFFRSGVDQFGQAEWRLDQWMRDLLERARRYRPASEPIVVEGAPATTDPGRATRSAGTTLEVRSAGVVDVSRALREVDLLCVPAEVPAVIHERDRSYTEVFSHGAFSGAERNPSAVKLNHAHEIETTFGKATRIDPWSELGCVATFRVSKVQAGDEALVLLQDGLVTPSVGFTVAASGQEWRGATRRIRKANLHHVALTADAAHETAVLAMRGSAH